MAARLRSAALQPCSANRCVSLVAVYRYPVADGTTALVLWDFVGRRPLARWTEENGPAGTPWILGQTALADTQSDVVLVAAICTTTLSATDCYSRIVRSLGAACVHLGGRTVQCWQLKPAAGGASAVTVAKSVPLPSPISSHHFGTGATQSFAPLSRSPVCGDASGFCCAGGSRGVVSTQDGCVYFVDWAKGEHFILGDGF